MVTIGTVSSVSSMFVSDTAVFSVAWTPADVPVVIRDRLTVMPSAGSGNLAHASATGRPGRGSSANCSVRYCGRHKPRDRTGPDGPVLNPGTVDLHLGHVPGQPCAGGRIVRDLSGREIAEKTRPPGAHVVRSILPLGSTDARHLIIGGTYRVDFRRAARFRPRSTPRSSIS